MPCTDIAASCPAFFPAKYSMSSGKCPRAIGMPTRGAHQPICGSRKFALRPWSTAHVMCQSWKRFAPHTGWSTVAMRVWNHQLFAPPQLASTEAECPLLRANLAKILWRIASMP